VALYAIAAAVSKSHVTPHDPSATWSLTARLAATWWRNSNARGIAEPDPRTVARGASPRRALASPCPHSKRRVRRERELWSQLNQVARLDAALVKLALVWVDPEHPRALARALHEAHAGRSWTMEDPTFAGRSYERRSPLYLPRRSSADAARFRRDYRAAVAFVRFAERQLVRERAERMRSLLAGLRPPASSSRPPITPYLHGERTIRSEPEVVEATEDLNRQLARIEAHFFSEPPPATT
jgi:hypothetical protein